MSIALFRKREERTEKDFTEMAEKSLSQALSEVQETADTGQKLPRCHGQLHLHRGSLEKGLHGVQVKISDNELEMERLTAEYNRQMTRLQSDTAEYSLTVKAITAAIGVYEEDAAVYQPASPPDGSTHQRVEHRAPLAGT